MVIKDIRTKLFASFCWSNFFIVLIIALKYYFTLSIVLCRQCLLSPPWLQMALKMKHGLDFLQVTYNKSRASHASHREKLTRIKEFSGKTFQSWYLPSKYLLELLCNSKGRDLSFQS